MKQKSQCRKILILITIIELVFTSLVCAHHIFHNFRLEYDAARLEYSDDGTKIRTPQTVFHTGIYRITIQLETGNAISGGITVGFDTSKGLHNDIFSADAPGTQYIFRTYVNRRNTAASVFVTNSPEMEVSVQYLCVEYLPVASCITAALSCLLLFFIPNLFLYFFLQVLDPSASDLLKRESKEHCINIIFLAVTAIFVSLPLFHDGLLCTHDALFHLGRIYGLERGLQTQFPVRIQPFWLNDYGYAVSICYGDFLLYIPALLNLAGFPLRLVYKGYIVTINLLTAGIATYSFGSIAENKRIGKICGFLYTASLWRLTDIYNRGALGEYSAITFYPLIFLGLWLLFQKNEYRKSFFFLLFGFTGIIQTHILSVVMVGFFVFLFCLLQLPKLFHRKIWGTLLASAGSILLLNAGFLIPFCDYLLTVPMRISELRYEYIQTYGSRIKELIPLKMYPASGCAPSTVEVRMTATIGLALLSILPAALFALIVLSLGKKEIRKKYLPLAGIFFLAILSLWMCTHYFPYDAIQEKIPILFQIIGSVQYPWRYYTIAMGLCTLLAALILPQMKRNRFLMPAFCAYLLLVCAIQGLLYQSEHLKHNTSVDLMDTIQLNDTYMAVEYNMLGTDILQTSPDILKSDSISALDVTRKGTNFTLSVTNSGTTGFIELPVFAYKGYLARSGRDRLNISSGFNNRLRIVIPAGYSGQINSCFAEPWYWRAAEIISLFTLIFVVTGFVRTFRVQKGE